MRRGAHLIAGAILASVSTLHSAEAAHARLLFRVDKVSAIIQGTTLTIDAIGAVTTGGWGRPRLRVKPSAPEAHIVEVEFLADPPPAKKTVIEALLPMKAQLRTPIPRYGAVAVRILSQTNEITTQIQR
jgi:hypothetical protein